MNKRQKKSTQWGGKWTQEKLDIFEKYVNAYLTIFNKHKYFETIYFDAFAGSGKRNNKNPELINQLEIEVFEENLYKGAAERVVSMDKKFNYYYFIEKDSKSLKELKDKIFKDYSKKGNEKLEFRSEDCNVQIHRLAQAMKNDNKLVALIFLDPFGMQINRESIQSLKDTKSDVWILLPTGVIINRLLEKNAELRNIKKLESFFGMKEQNIRNEFYKTEITPTLFGEEMNIVTKVKNPIKKIAKLYIKNMKNIWKYVSENPLVLKNNSGTPIFHFVFASNNEHARKIAQQIIDSK